MPSLPDCLRFLIDINYIYTLYIVKLFHFVCTDAFLSKHMKKATTGILEKLELWGERKEEEKKNLQPNVSCI